MPLYKYKCSCGEKIDKIHGMSETPEVKCSKCGEEMSRLVTGGTGSYIKAATVGKYQKEERTRKKKRAAMSVRQYEKYGGKNKLVPNVEGQEVSSWEEAKVIATQKGLKDSTKYDKYIDEEKNSNNSAGIDERKLSALKEEAQRIH